MSSKSSRESVKVCVRCRPLKEDEVANGYQTVVTINERNATCTAINPQGGEVVFKYDYTFDPSCTQEDVYEKTAASVVSSVLDGYNGTIFAYGQTGTGKTFTMDGNQDGDLRGIAPRAFEHIFDFIQVNQAEYKFSLMATYVELYQEQVRDLLSKTPDQVLQLREDSNGGFYVQNVTTQKINDLNDLRKVQNIGRKRRKTRKTNMNDSSSRSHSILTITIETLGFVEGATHVRKGKLNLVDLAGSERMKKTGTDAAGGMEGIGINYGLLILGNCIEALTTPGSTHIPFRDSKLTKLLRDSLGGNAKTLMIANVGPADYNHSETMSTLRYAERAKKIKNDVKINMDPKDALLLEYKLEMERLQKELDKRGQIAANPELALKQMEDDLAKQRKQLEDAVNMEKEEKDKLERQVQEGVKKIKEQKQFRQEFENKLKELNKYLVNDTKGLIEATQKNESQIQAKAEKLKQRAEKAQELEKQIKQREISKKEMEAKVDSIEGKVSIVSSNLKELISHYKNLKAYIPELQSSIQQDHQALADELADINTQIDVYNIIIKNFIPEEEVKKMESLLLFNADSQEYILRDLDKKSLQSMVTHRKRPPSAHGNPHPKAVTEWKPPLSKKDSEQQVELKPLPLRIPLLDDPVTIDLQDLEEEIEIAFEEGQESNFDVDIPASLPLVPVK